MNWWKGIRKAEEVDAPRRASAVIASKTSQPLIRTTAPTLRPQRRVTQIGHSNP